MPPGFFLRVRVLSRLFRQLFLEKLAAAHDAGRLRFFGNHARLIEPSDADEPPMHSLPCPCCGGRMIVIETFERGSTPRMAGVREASEEEPRAEFARWCRALWG